MEYSTKQVDAQSALINDRDFLKEIINRFLQTVLEDEFVEQIGAARYERSSGHPRSSQWTL